jgi:4-hydroxy-tetrahydrodipicolinate reductase
VKIALIGYGKMGRLVEAAAVRLGHEVVLTVDPLAPDAAFRPPHGHESSDFAEALQGAVRSSGAEGLIEFSQPHAVVPNLRALLPLALPLVVGTTGWKDAEGEVAALAARTGGTLVRSANFSLGVNLFYRIVTEAARLIGPFADYDAAVYESHHRQKADSPSGTALEIARRILAAEAAVGGQKQRLQVGSYPGLPDPAALQVVSTRLGSVPGTHTVTFDSSADTIVLTHTARTREGFALGALHALDRLTARLAAATLPPGRIYGMEDLL